MRYSTRSEAPTISADADRNHILCRTFHIFVSFRQAFYVSLKATMSHNELVTIIPSPFLVLCSVYTVTSQREPPGQSRTKTQNQIQHINYSLLNLNYQILLTLILNYFCFYSLVHCIHTIFSVHLFEKCAIVQLLLEIRRINL